MLLACKHATAPTCRPCAVTRAWRNLRTRPPLPIQSTACRVKPSASAKRCTAETDDVAETQRVNESKQLLDRLSRHRPRPLPGSPSVTSRLGDASEHPRSRCTKSQALLADGQPGQRRRPAVALDQARHQGRLRAWSLARVPTPAPGRSSGTTHPSSRPTSHPSARRPVWQAGQTRIDRY